MKTLNTSNKKDMVSQPCLFHYPTWQNIFYTLKQLPPINSLANEFWAIPSVGSAKK